MPQILGHHRVLRLPQFLGHGPQRPHHAAGGVGGQPADGVEAQQPQEGDGGGVGVRRLGLEEGDCVAWCGVV